MATINKTPLICVGTLHGGPPVIRTYPEAALQTFKKGEAVYLDGSGNIAEFTESIDDDSQQFVGFAAEDGHNSASAALNVCEVYIASAIAGNIFEANVCAAGAADQVTAKTQVGVVYPMYHDITLGQTRVDISDTAGNENCCNVLEIVGIVGDTNGRVKFTVLPLACQVVGDAT